MARKDRKAKHETRKLDRHGVPVGASRQPELADAVLHPDEEAANIVLSDVRLGLLAHVKRGVAKWGGSAGYVVGVGKAGTDMFGFFMVELAESPAADHVTWHASWLSRLAEGPRTGEVRRQLKAAKAASNKRNRERHEEEEAAVTAALAQWGKRPEDVEFKV